MKKSIFLICLALMVLFSLAVPGCPAKEIECGKRDSKQIKLEYTLNKVGNFLIVTGDLLKGESIKIPFVDRLPGNSHAITNLVVQSLIRRVVTKVTPGGWLGFVCGACVKSIGGKLCEMSDKSIDKKSVLMQIGDQIGPLKLILDLKAAVACRPCNNCSSELADSQVLAANPKTLNCISDSSSSANNSSANSSVSGNSAFFSNDVSGEIASNATVGRAYFSKRSSNTRLTPSRMRVAQSAKRTVTRNSKQPLLVMWREQPLLILPGDFNADGFVDASDQRHFANGLIRCPGALNFSAPQLLVFCSDKVAQEFEALISSSRSYLAP